MGTTSNQTGDHLNLDASQCFKRQGIRTQREQIDSSTQTDRNIRAAGIMLEILNNRNILPMRRAYKLHSKMKMRGLEHSIVAITLGTYYILLASCFPLLFPLKARSSYRSRHLQTRTLTRRISIKRTSTDWCFRPWQRPWREKT